MGLPYRKIMDHLLYCAGSNSNMWCRRLACMLKNREESDLRFWGIFQATRNSELDVVVDGEKHGDAEENAMLQYAAQGTGLEANISGVFVLARSRPKGSN